MRLNITQKMLVLIVTLVLCLGFIWTNRVLAWTANIIAEGEEVGSVNVKIGVASEAQMSLASPMSVIMNLHTPVGTALSEDIRQEGDMRYTWIIGVNPNGNIVPLDPDRTATLSWNPMEFGPGTYELRHGSDGTGPVAVADMRTTQTYVAETIQFLTVIFIEADNDEDDMPDKLDNCPNIFNPNQEDGDGDGTGNACDNCPANPNKTDPGVCGCEVADTDSDYDGTPNCSDNCPDVPNPEQGDFDKDGLGDMCDPDDDNDGMSDECENQYNLNSVGDDALLDQDNDGYTNLQEYLAGTDPTDDTSKPQGAMTDWYVDGAVEESGDGRTWSTAFKTIQEAIDSAEDGLNEIWVKQGNYVISATIEVSKPVVMYAGFTGTETLRRQRNWETNVTVVNGDNAVGCFSVSTDAIIDGFTITNGSAEEGGGILNWDGSSPTVTNCTFLGNEGFKGGAIYNDELSSPTITKCTFLENGAQANGGAIHNDTSNAKIRNCIFFNNQLTREWESGGGGICNENSNAVITNCIFLGNHVNATESSGGGAIFNISASPTITNCTIVGNSVAIGETLGDEVISGGGGILNIDGSEPVITNCIVRENTARSGSEIYDVISDDDDNYVNSSSTVTYCNVKGGYEGTNNIDADPLFVDPENGDFHLQYGSPCIDTGDNNAPQLPNSDFEGGPRILDGRIDMGADEAFVSAAGISIGIGVLSGGIMTSCVYVDPAALPDDANKPDHFLYDHLIEMEIKNVDSGLVIIRISLPDLPPPPEGYGDWRWYKRTTAGEWIDFSRDVISNGTGDGAEINGNVVTLYITDNGPYDEDPTEGIIQDPSGLGIATAASVAPSEDDKVGCFIATAAYGTPFEGHVMILRQFRDVYLLPSKIGRAFVDFYWKYSPPLADFIAKHDSLRAVVRVGLAPVVGMAYVALHTTNGQKMVLALVILGLLGSTYIVVMQSKRRIKSSNQNA